MKQDGTLDTLVQNNSYTSTALRAIAQMHQETKLQKLHKK